MPLCLIGHSQKKRVGFDAAFNVQHATTITTHSLSQSPIIHTLLLLLLLSHCSVICTNDAPHSDVPNNNNVYHLFIFTSFIQTLGRTRHASSIHQSILFFFSMLRRQPIIQPKAMLHNNRPSHNNVLTNPTTSSMRENGLVPITSLIQFYKN